MFSAALKSISSTNINSNYSISNQVSTAGPWKIHDAKKKSTGQQYSVFIFDKKSLDSNGASGFGGRGSSSNMKRTVEDVVERLKKEASCLARLRHPNILELVEPVEETRGGGLQFVTEPVSVSLASLLREKDDQERAAGVGGRSSRYVTEDADGTRRRRELEIDELEIQKGLLQISKALEFLHDNAGLVHGNLTPEGILVNAKSDWKISGLSFCTPAEGSNKPTSIQSINLSEALNPDPRLPRFVQLDLDYTSPDFVLDSNLMSAADMFSLGLLCITLYTSPHKSPIECHGSVSSYRRIFQSSSTVPNSQNGFMSTRPLPKELSTHVLPRLITRRPAQRMTAKEFQESEYFNNILVSSIRFLDSFPAKTPNEKQSFLRGLLKVLPEFPKSVMEKKLLPALLEEMKDKDLLSLILQNVFKMLSLLPAARRVFSDRVRPSLKETFVSATPRQPHEKDPAKDAGLMVVLDNMNICAENSSGKEFKDDMLPVILAAIECPTHAIVDAALRGLPAVLPVLDYSTIKNELFPVIAAVFSRTNSLAIKVRGLQAFVVLCGGSNDGSVGSDGLDGLPQQKKTSSSSALDKYTMQEKLIPLIKAIKTKEPAVMIAALNVMRVVGQVADAEFVAMEILPILWSMSLGPLLDLAQFKLFVELIKTLGQRVEDEQIRKLGELSGQGGSSSATNEDFLSFGGLSGTQFEENGTSVDDFESLVKGRPSTRVSSPTNPMDDDAGWGRSSVASATTVGGMSSIGARAASPALSAGKSSTAAPTFSWSTPSPTTTVGTGSSAFGAKPTSSAAGGFRTVTPDHLGTFPTLTPSSTQFSKPLQPTQPAPSGGTPTTSTNGSLNWGATTAASASSNPWASSSSFGSSSTITPSASNLGAGMGAINLGGGASRPGIGQPSVSSSSLGSIGSKSSFSLAPPPSATTPSASSGGGFGGFSLTPPPGAGSNSNGLGGSGIGGPTGGSAFKYGAGLSGGIGPNSMASFMAQKQVSSPSNIGMGMSMGMGVMTPQQQQGQPKSGLDKYESLL